MPRTATKDDAANDPKLTGSGWKYMAKRVLSEFSRDQGTDQAAKLTYFLVLSLAPTLLAVFSLATLLLSGIQDQISGVLKDGIARSGLGQSMDDPQALNTLVDATLDKLMGSATGGTIALIIGIATALWSASAYVKAFSRVSNQIYDIPEGRNAIKLNGSMLGVTLGFIVGILLIMVSLLLNRTLVDSVAGPIASRVGATGALDFLSDTFLPVWTWVKWPVIVILLILVISLVYWAAPNVKKPFRLISPGGVFAVVGIAVAAVVLSIYLSTFASYSSYGAIGGLMAILFALWVMNIVVVMGAEVDAEFERAKELTAGKPAEDSLVLPLRGEKGAEKKEQKYEEVVDAGRDLRLENLHRDSEAYTGDDSRLTGSVGRERGGSHPTRSDATSPESRDD
ncbi:YihY/virulence factor BrkB family protein [Brachybacterium huguangmaarense]|uniref:YihY/virulence factor BrkB family protein n=1 Tax=Brachybacterium huguangmaarense TaxID=1652028 RepID=A0ABY6FY24_9MICO|nr:YihY/virulence factor BrkB family protein [Brachybacterium huguangmaarense]UYG15735.1 YihY/virulence factor BrkB family protein [Brachybacterium huguangmaarense]